MADEKRVTFGVSISPTLLEAVDGHASQAGEDRSSYIRRLVTADLTAAGKLPGDPRAEVAELARAAADVVGTDKVVAALRRLGGAKMASAGKEAA